MLAECEYVWDEWPHSLHKRKDDLFKSTWDPSILLKIWTGNHYWRYRLSQNQSHWLGNTFRRFLERNCGFFSSSPLYLSFMHLVSCTTTAALRERLCHCRAAPLLFCCVFFKIPENFSKCDISKSTSCRLVAALKSPAFIWRDFLLEKAFQGFFKMPFTYGESKIPAQKLNDSGSDVPEIRVKTVFNG